MQITSEDQLLDINVRKAILKEICGEENQERKNQAYKRYEMFKDRIKKYVMLEMKKQFDESTVKEMSGVLSNVSIVKKIINKLAKVYSSGAERKIEVTEDGEPNEDAQKNLNKLEKQLEMNTQMKKLNRFLKLQKNGAAYVKPCKVIEVDGAEKYKMKNEILNPYLYDAIPNPYDKEKALAHILSDYIPSNGMVYTTGDPGIRGNILQPVKKDGDGKDQAIADNPIDEAKFGNRSFIWWSNKYHFTTNHKGEITSGEETNNPILKDPVVDFAIDQDGSFWAIGGDDLIDAGTLINSMLTNVQHIGVVQGYGQFWMKGKNLPRQVAVGPTKSILMEYVEGDPVPDLGFAQSNPQLEQLKSLIEMYVALTLSTNNLSTKGVAANLQGGADFPSGIAMMIDNSESTEDINDQQQIFVDKEPQIWDLVFRWMNLYGSTGQLVEDLKDIKIPKNSKVVTSFKDQQPILSEKEHLEIIEKRKDIGINTMIDLIKKDNPGMNDEDAKKKLKEILEDKIARAEQAVKEATTLGIESDPEAEDDEEPVKPGEKPSEGSKRPGLKDKNLK